MSSTDLFYQKILDDYINIYNLNYSTNPADPGGLLYRYSNSDMDIDLRIVKNEKLFLQFYSSKFVYVFEWVKSKEEFLQIKKFCKYWDLEKSIHNFMSAITKDTRKYIALKYGLK